LLHNIQSALPPAPIAVDNAALAQIHDAEQFLIDNYRKVLKALVEKAREGSVGAADIIRKIIADFKSEQQEIRVAERPTSPPPIQVRIGAAHIRFAIEGGKGKPPLQLSTAEFAELPSDKQTDLHQNYDLQIIEPLAIAPPAEAAIGVTDPPADTVAAPSSQKKPNCTCMDCGTEFYAHSPKTTKRCHECMDARQKQRLAAYQSAHGRKLSPAIKAARESEPEKSDGVLPL
jgi:hypothetical protein